MGMSVPEENLNLVQVFHSRAERFRDAPALFYKDPSRTRYLPVNWTEWSRAVSRTAAGLFGLGVRHGDRIALLAENCPEWTYADLGTLTLGGIVVPIYPTSSCKDIAYILNHAEAEVLFLSNIEQHERLSPVFDDCPKLHTVILFTAVTGRASLRTLSLRALWDLGDAELLREPGLCQRTIQTVKSDDLATIIYTSGTTGEPKGVMLTHHNLMANYAFASKVIKIGPQDTALSFLPLSHIFERLAGYYFIAFNGTKIAYAESMQTVADDLLLVKPTVVVSVPRLYEKIYLRILETVSSAPSWRRGIFAWAIRVGRKVAGLRCQKKEESIGLRIAYKMATLLVFNQLKKKLGGRLRFFISGGAPLAKTLAEFYFATDIMILEGYGLTETSPVISVNTLEAFKFGTVGRLLPGIEVKIAEDGEIVTRSSCVMKGYYRNPRATEEAIRDGWFYTGDIGLIDPQGFLAITDRKKDIIVTSGGKNISPSKIENLILNDKIFSQAVVVGDRRNYLVALLVPDRQSLKAEARKVGLPDMDWHDLLKRSEVYRFLEAKLNNLLRDLPRYEQIKYFALLEEELTQAKGEITPTMKVRRRMIQEKYHMLIDGLYHKGSGKGTP